MRIAALKEEITMRKNNGCYIINYGYAIYGRRAVDGLYSRCNYR